MASFDQKVEAHHQMQADALPDHVEDTSLVSRVLKVVSVSSLFITIALALNTFSFSADVTGYESNRELFFNIAFACTVIYFITAYWAMRRQKALAK